MVCFNCIEHRYDDMEGESNEGLVEDQRREKLQVVEQETASIIFCLANYTQLGGLLSGVLVIYSWYAH